MKRGCEILECSQVSSSGGARRSQFNKATGAVNVKIVGSSGARAQTAPPRAVGANDRRGAAVPQAHHT